MADRTEANETKYKTYCSTLTKIECRAKIDYYNNKCVEVKSNMKNLWLVINQAIGKHSDKSTVIKSIKVNNIHQYSSKAIANELVKYFSTVGKTFAEKIPNAETSIGDYLSKINNCGNNIFLQPTVRLKSLE